MVFLGDNNYLGISESVWCLLCLDSRGCDVRRAAG